MVTQGVPRGGGRRRHNVVRDRRSGGRARRRGDGDGEVSFFSNGALFPPSFRSFARGSFRGGEERERGGRLGEGMDMTPNECVLADAVTRRIEESLMVHVKNNKHSTACHQQATV